MTIDPHGGLSDLEHGELRILHPGSFADDPTRALRAARYVARYGFSLERETEERLRDADLATVSADRVEAELRKLARERQARRGFELLAEWGLLEVEEEQEVVADGLVLPQLHQVHSPSSAGKAVHGSSPSTVTRTSRTGTPMAVATS